MPFYEAGRKEGDFDRGIERLVAAVLVSPDFLYRTIRGPQAARAGAEYALTDYELATRLSFFLWNTGPDEELFKLAASRELSKPAVLDAQVTRMLADPKASSLVTNFAMKWLGLDGLDEIKPDQQILHELQRPVATGSGDRGGSVHPQRAARESPDRRTADVGPDLSERSRRAPLRAARASTALSSDG